MNAQLLSANAQLFDTLGYKFGNAVVEFIAADPCDSMDADAYVINGTSHNASDIVHDVEGGTLLSLAAGWTVKL
jgi:hypothetical protein